MSFGLKTRLYSQKSRRKKYQHQKSISFRKCKKRCLTRMPHGLKHWFGSTIIRTIFTSLGKDMTNSC